MTRRSVEKQMQTDDHELIDSLLPWFVNRTLEPVEHDQVRRHVESCEACRTSVSLLSMVQSIVRHSTATPMVPPPRTETLLQAIEDSARRSQRSRPVVMMLLAVSFAAVLLLVALLLPDQKTTITPSARYETTTSTALVPSMDYVLNVEFEPGTPHSVRERVLRGLEAHDIDQGELANVYQVTVNLPAASLEELEEFTGDVEALPQVRSVSVIALQLPMKRPQ
jgi:hypothetical protein